MTSGYSYVSQRPEPPGPARSPVDTPPYYQQLDGRPRQSQQPKPTQRPVSTHPADRTRITKHPIRSDWAPDPSLEPHARRALCDEMLLLAVDGCFVLGVTAVGETRAQKSRVAAEVALALAESAHPRVLLLEADFQWPDVHRLMGVDMPMSMGFSQQLRGRSPAKADAWTVVECLPTLHVLAEGIMRSPGMILSVRFEEALTSLRTYYDFIVLNGPDTSAVVECRAMNNVTDGAAIVAPAEGHVELPGARDLFAEQRLSTIVRV